MSPQPWQEAFLGVSALLGEPLEASVGALLDHPTFHAEDLLRGLRASSRQERAQAIASALAPVAAGLGEMRLQ